MSAQEAPIDVLRRAFEALDAGEWDRLSSMFDPGDVQQFRDEQVSMLVAWARVRPDRANQRSGNRMYGFGSSGTVDPADVERFGDTPVPAFPGRPTLKAVAALSPPRFMAEWFAASDAMGGGSPMFEFGGGRSAHREILGVVLEGDSLAHVLYRTKSERIIWSRSTPPMVQSLKRGSDGAWAILVPYDLALGAGMMMTPMHPDP